MSLMEYLMMGSYLWALGLYLDLRRVVGKLRANHLQHLEDRIQRLEQDEIQRKQADLDSVVVNRVVQSRLRSLETQSTADREGG